MKEYTSENQGLCFQFLYLKYKTNANMLNFAYADAVHYLRCKHHVHANLLHEKYLCLTVSVDTQLKLLKLEYVEY